MEPEELEKAGWSDLLEQGLRASRSRPSAQPPTVPEVQPHSAALTCWLRNSRVSGLLGPEAQNLHKSHVGEHSGIPQHSLVIPSTYAHDVLTRVREAGRAGPGPDFQVLQSWDHFLFPLVTPGSGSGLSKQQALIKCRMMQA